MSHAHRQNARASSQLELVRAPTLRRLRCPPTRKKGTLHQSENRRKCTHSQTTLHVSIGSARALQGGCLTQEFKDATKNFGETMTSSFHIIMVQWVQNPQEYCRYLGLKATWQSSGRYMNQKVLRTKMESISPICATGFNGIFAAVLMVHTFCVEVE